MKVICAFLLLLNQESELGGRIDDNKDVESGIGACKIKPGSRRATQLRARRCRRRRRRWSRTGILEIQEACRFVSALVPASSFSPFPRRYGCIHDSLPREQLVADGVFAQSKGSGDQVATEVASPACVASAWYPLGHVHVPLRRKLL